MKIYYGTGACSLSPHIVLREAGLSFDLEQVDLKTKKTKKGEDFLKISAKGYVPHLILDNGEHLTEGVAMIQYIADQKPETKLMPAFGTMERIRVVEWLNFIATELHKSHFPLFHTETGVAAAEVYSNKLRSSYDFVAKELAGKSYLMGEQFTVADAYLFTVLNWAKFVKIDLSAWPVLVDYQKRVAARPGVQEALKAEGLK